MKNFGYGQMGPLDTASDFNVDALTIKRFLTTFRTAAVVQVISCTNSGDLAAVGFVDVQPMVNMLDGLGNAMPHGTVYNIPYFRVQGGTNAVIIDPEVGDIGLAIFADRDISAVKVNRAVSNPGSFRRADMADGLYFGGFLNAVPTQYFRFCSVGIYATDKNGNTIKMEAAGVTINGVLIDRSGNVSGIKDLTSTGTQSLGGGSQAVKLADGSSATKVKAT